MITDYEFDGLYWTVTVADKYKGTSMILLFAVWKAMWLALQSRENE